MLRRRSLPAELEGPSEAFTAVLALLEPAKAALTAVVPTTRLPGAPFPDALASFEDALAGASARMSGWRRPALEHEWQACAAGIAVARDRARRLREDAPELGGFEGLIWAVEHLLEPLEPFESASRAFRGYRRR